MIPLDPAGAPRKAKDLGRWMRWVEDQLKLRGSNRGIIERGSVGGGLTTIREILTDPAAGVKFWNRDFVVATADDEPVTLPLTYVPFDESLIVAKNGVVMLRSEWARSGNVVTVEPSDELTIRAGDVIHSPLYAFGPQVQPAPAAPIEFLGYSPGSIDAWTIPAEAVEGCLLVAAGMVDEAKSVVPNDWEALGESTAVTHGTAHSPFTYRMVVLSTVWDGTSTVPTFSGTGGQSTCLMAAFSGGTTVDATFNHLDDGLTAYTPAINPSSLRVWGTLGSFITITPSQGTPVGYAGGDDIDIAMTLDPATDAVAATADGPAGWCLASLVVR